MNNELDDLMHVNGSLSLAGHHSFQEMMKIRPLSILLSYFTRKKYMKSYILGVAVYFSFSTLFLKLPYFISPKDYPYSFFKKQQ